jgi:hypothetical protein
MRLRLRTEASNKPIFISQEIYEHGKPWWSDIGREKLLILPPELCDSPISRVT